MIEGLLLQQRLDAVRAAQRAVRRRWALVLPLLIGALAAGGLAVTGGLGLTEALWVLPLTVGSWALLSRWWKGRKQAADVEVARAIEAADPELDARLLTAVGILERPTARVEGPSFLERRVIAEALNAGDAEEWVEKVIGNRLKVAARWGTLALAVFLAAMVWLAASLREELLPRQAEATPTTERNSR